MEKMWNGTEYMSLVFKLDMCTCGGKAPEKIVSTRRCDGSFSVVSEFFFRKKREKPRDETLIIHLFSPLNAMNGAWERMEREIL
jgi:hypothetical protein